MITLRKEQVFAHRGSSYAAPENTLAALQLAIDEGAGGVEFDVQISRDLVPFLFHDGDLKRFGAPRKNLLDLSWDAISNVDVGRWISPLYEGERIPDLIAALMLFVETDMQINIELKRAPQGLEAELITATLAAIEEVPETKSKIIFSSFQQDLLAEARIQESLIPRAVLYDYLPTNWQEEARALDVQAIHCSIEHLTAPQVREIKKMGYQVRCYTINNPHRLDKLGDDLPDAIFTDCPVNFLIDRAREAKLSEIERHILQEAAQRAAHEDLEQEIGSEDDSPAEENAAEATTTVADGEEAESEPDEIVLTEEQQQQQEEIRARTEVRLALKQKLKENDTDQQDQEPENNESEAAERDGASEVEPD